MSYMDRRQARDLDRYLTTEPEAYEEHPSDADDVIGNEEDGWDDTELEIEDDEEDDEENEITWDEDEEVE